MRCGSILHVRSPHAERFFLSPHVCCCTPASRTTRHQHQQGVFPLSLSPPTPPPSIRDVCSTAPRNRRLITPQLANCSLMLRTFVSSHQDPSFPPSCKSCHAARSFCSFLPTKRDSSATTVTFPGDKLTQLYYTINPRKQNKTKQKNLKI